jgi:hypothetical protein
VVIVPVLQFVGNQYVVPYRYKLEKPPGKPPEMMIAGGREARPRSQGAAAVALTIAVSLIALLSAQLGPSELLAAPQTVSFRYTRRCVERPDALWQLLRCVVTFS